MKAIVLSCDKYHPITYHMITTYEKLWPSNKLTYRVPWNENLPTTLINTFKDKIEPINTPIEFKKTILGLVDDLDDNDWIFWCSDDTYLIDINEEEANKTFSFVETLKDPNIYGVTFGYVRQVPQNTNPDKYLKHLDLTFLERTALTQQWAHQFWRVKVLKQMFNCLDEPPKYQAKQMDYMLHTDNPFWKYINNGKMYTLDHNSAIWGESTHRGKLTQNCIDSFKQYNLSIPKDFDTSPITIFFT